MNYLLDAEFLKQLNEYEEKEVYIRIISLTNDEYPREQIEGRVSGGSINLDGASAVRRSCSLSMLALDNDAIITNEYWCFNNKFKLQIGLRNFINPIYPDIIWFDKGIYIITSFNISRSTSSLSISISGKDKMCRLNGEVSGSLPIGTDFGTEEIIEEVPIYDENGNPTGKTTYNTIINKLHLAQIIRNAVKEYGQEKDENIIINDLPEFGYELWDYRGDSPMYLFIKAENEIVPQEKAKLEYINMTFNNDTVLGGTKIDQIGKYFSLNTLDADYNKDCTILYYGTTPIVVAKIEYGDTAGYHQTPLVYSGDLVLGAGEPVTSMLDKIKTMLGNFEYFYDLQGRFIFQKNKTYLQELFSPANGNQVEPIALATPYIYKFEDISLFTQISDSPNIENAKNEYVVWGARKSATGDDLPIHARYAIDKKPTRYISPFVRYERINDIGYLEIEEVIINESNYKEGKYYEEGSENSYVLCTDKEYNGNKPLYNITLTNLASADKQLYHYNYKDQSYTKYTLPTEVYYKTIGTIVTQNKNYDEYYKNKKPEEEIDLIQYHYYTLREANREYNNIDYDWREIIYQMAIDFYANNQRPGFLKAIEKENSQFIGGRTGYEQYYSDLQAFWRQLYNPNPNAYDYQQYGDFYASNEEDKYWNHRIHHDPHSLNFWFDFLDVGGEISNYSVKKIETRTTVVNESSLKSIYYKETPEVQFIVYPKEEIPNDTNAYDKIIIQENMENLFYRSAQGSSIIDKINTLINQHAMQIAGISLTTIPIYYLEPNTRIYIEGYGDYTLDKISFSLTYNGTMSLTGTKVMTSII